jgi:hypothetical protein
MKYKNFKDEIYQITKISPTGKQLTAKLIGTGDIYQFIYYDYSGKYVRKDRKALDLGEPIRENFKLNEIESDEDLLLFFKKESNNIGSIKAFDKLIEKMGKTPTEMEWKKLNRLYNRTVINSLENNEILQTIKKILKIK